MKIVIAGGSGFLGGALRHDLLSAGHTVVTLSRGGADSSSGKESTIRWSPDGQAGAWADAIDGADAVVNLSGESIAARRWSTAQKERIRDSRIRATRSIVAAIARASDRPKVLISGSASGYYGDRGAEELTESSTPGSDFLADVCVRWEAEARRAEELGVRVVTIRTGIVLDAREGALPQMLPPFRFFAGGPLGSGRQFMPWIHRADWVALVTWTIASSVSGPVNATAPEPATNREFSSALGRALGRPSWIPAPGFALRLILGEMADALLLSGQRAIPERATTFGFKFQFERLEDALGDLFSRRAHL